MIVHLKWLRVRCAINSGIIIFVYCKALSPILDQQAVEYDGKIDIYKVDVDQEPELEAAFAIRTIPNLLLCPMGGKPSMKLGTMNKTQLKALIEEVLL